MCVCVRARVRVHACVRVWCGVDGNIQMYVGTGWIWHREDCVSLCVYLCMHVSMCYMCMVHIRT